MIYSPKNFSLVKKLEHNHFDEIINFLHTQKDYAHEQFPPFVLATSNEKYYFFTQYTYEQISAFACINIRKGFFAEILFGPIVNHESEYESTVDEIAKALKRKGILILRVIPPKLNIADSSPNFSSHRSHFNWATLQLNIENSIDEIFKQFADRHKWSIKKALKENVIVEEINDSETISKFAKQYTEMYQSRGLKIDYKREIIRFTAILNCFQQYKNGFFLAVKNNEKEIIGGICIRLQGSSAYYFKGYAHPQHRHIPINHIALFQAINHAKRLGKSIFDFGGYALNAKQDVQLQTINHFKDGFRGTVSLYPLTRYYYSIRFVKFTHKGLDSIKKILRKCSIWR